MAEDPPTGPPGPIDPAAIPAVDSGNVPGDLKSPPSISAAMSSFVSVPVDGLRLPLVAVPCFIAPASLLETSGFASHFAITHQAVLATVTAQAGLPPISFAAPQAKPPVEESKTEPAGQTPGMKTAGDGFNWRKYGQKQVKGTDNARSYYRCTQESCPAKKKVEHRQDGAVLEVVYLGDHTHEPPPKPRFAKEKRPFPLETSPPPTDKPRPPSSPEHQEKPEEEPPESKRRALDRPKAVAVVVKTAKEPKVVKHTASDPDALSDGYRWRKYGQKFVKGNPNPRSYYRCTHAGCPARRHVEKDSLDDAAMIINYEGTHNHELPQPRTPTAAVSSPPATEAGAQAAPTESAADGSLESAKTLLSIGATRQILDDHPPPVSV